MKLIMEFGCYDAIEKRVSELVDCLGVTDSVVTKATQYLVENNYLLKSGFTNGSGRPSFRYQCSDKSIVLLKNEKYDNKIIHHKTLIADLLQPDSTGKNNIQRHPLNISNRLLLIVLLSHSDECGFVNSLGVADIMKITGMTRDRLKSQMQTLSKTGYLIHQVSGITGQYLFGTSKGGYYLDLKHSNFNSYSGATFLYIQKSYGKSIVANVDVPFSEAQNILKKTAIYEISKKQLEKDKHKWLQDIRDKYLSLTNRMKKEIEKTQAMHKIQIEQKIKRLRTCYSENARQICLQYSAKLKAAEVLTKFSRVNVETDFADYNDFIKIYHFFKDSKESRVREYFYFKICEYASNLLSEFWEELGKDQNIKNDDLSDRIKRDLVIKNSFNDSDNPEKVADQLALFVLGLAIDFAMSVKNLLQYKLDLDFSELRYMIIPLQQKHEIRTIISIELFDLTKKPEAYLYKYDEQADIDFSLVIDHHGSNSVEKTVAKKSINEKGTFTKSERDIAYNDIHLIPEPFLVRDVIPVNNNVVLDFK